MVYACQSTVLQRPLINLRNYHSYVKLAPDELFTSLLPFKEYGNIDENVVEHVHVGRLDWFFSLQLHYLLINVLLSASIFLEWE